MQAEPRKKGETPKWLKDIASWQPCPGCKTLLMPLDCKVPCWLCEALTNRQKERL